MANTRVTTVGLALLVSAAMGSLVPAVAAAGSISGTVTEDTPGKTPIGGIEVCSHVTPYEFEDTCAETNGSGAYALNGLPQGSYKVHFSDFRNNRNYVDQYYDDRGEYNSATPVNLGEGENRTGVGAEMHPGGTIAGRVTDFASGNPVADFPVCARANTMFGEIGRCGHTNGNGEYAVNGLPPEEYAVEFFGEVTFNYLTQYYDGVASQSAATLIPIAAANETKSSFDAELKPGVEISGTLTEAGTHRPLPEVRVDLLAPGTEEVHRLTFTDAGGDYAFRGQSAGIYVVAFSRPQSPFDGDGFSTQYYRNATSFAGATPLTVVPPDVLTGIDGEVEGFPRWNPLPTQGIFLPTAQAPPPKCRKGFRKKMVRGKRRCVKIHKKRHRRAHGHGPRARAAAR